MKLVLLIVEATHKEEVEAFLHRAGVEGYTEIPGALGMGSTGQRLGSRAFPKTSALILTMLPDGEEARLAGELKAFCSECGERVRMLAVPAEDLLA